MDVNKISEQLLLAVKMEEPTTSLVEELANVSFGDLRDTLTTDTHKKAFWINAYNAYFQILRKEQHVDKPAIYKERLVEIAGQKLSLDDIEHGILRQGKFKEGAAPPILLRNLIEELMVATVDYRIHFSLNCGAKSCPPIAFYSVEKLEQQLEMATIGFLESETDILTDKKEAHVTALFNWFEEDFGGKTGVLAILAEKLNVNMEGFQLVYKEYSWEEDLGNFVV